MKYSKDEQIVLVLNDEVDTLFWGVNGKRPKTKEQKRKLVSFNRKDAQEYVDSKGFPPGSIIKGSSLKDGVHLDKIDEKWCIYYQEKGSRSLHFQDTNAQTVKYALIDLLIYLSGLTGSISFGNNFYNKQVIEFFDWEEGN